jgi:replicative DNA helicase
MNDAHFQLAADVLDSCRESIQHGTPPTLFPVGSGDFALLEVGPGLVTLIGGAPAVGKSALTTQLVFEALANTSELRALVCSVEMSPGVLLERQLARLADIDLTTIRHRRLTAEHGECLDRGLSILAPLCNRLAFVSPPYDLENVTAVADAFDVSLIVLDYIQRIPAPGKHGDRRGVVDATMRFLRQFADDGRAIIVVAALARSKDRKGRSSYTEGLSLASFRETSELEYGADDAFLLVPEQGEGAAPSRVVLKHLKSRHGETHDIRLNFDRAHQRFSPVETAKTAARSVKGKLDAALRTVWESTRPAPEDGDDDR